MHFWLDPKNAILLTQEMANKLSIVDPTHAAIYQENGKQLKIRLKQLDKTIATQLKTVKNVPFIVFHDAYQYFEYRYGLNGVGAITLHPEIPPSAKRLNTIREIILSSKAKCVFTEPQFQPKLVQSIIQDLKVNTAELDPLGTEPLDNKNGYFILLENLTSSLRRCLDK
jgi:zinc transport system substrate-binding protein